MVLRLAAEQSPTETDAPAEEASVNPVPYDAGLLSELETHGPDALKEYGMIVVRGTGDTARFNSALWYALAHDLVYEHRADADCVIITDPKE